MIVGIDYGSKLAGTTALAFWETATQPIILYQSAKKQDADQFIIEKIEEHQPDLVMLDAPLSLPMTYRDSSFTPADYFYRQSDRLLGAMSPMFLGGLTARAMKLAADLRAEGITVLETYPAQQAKRLQLDKTLYKKEINALPALLELVRADTPLQISEVPTSWHSFDAILALLAGIRFKNKISTFFGEATEGGIYI